MKRLMLLIGSLTVLLSACGTAGDIEIHDPWVRPTAQGENAAIYFQLHNHSKNADEEVTFAPGGLHLMLVDIKQELKAGDHIGVILHFKSHEDIVVNVSVGGAAGNAEDHEHQ